MNRKEREKQVLQAQINAGHAPCIRGSVLETKMNATKGANAAATGYHSFFKHNYTKIYAFFLDAVSRGAWNPTCLSSVYHQKSISSWS